MTQLTLDFIDAGLLKNLSQMYTKRLRLLEKNPKRCLENWDELIRKIKNKEPLL